MDELTRLKLILSQLVEYHILCEKYEKEIEELIKEWHKETGIPPLPESNEANLLRKQLSAIIKRMSRLAK